jgi:hypothetical protein
MPAIVSSLACAQVRRTPSCSITLSTCRISNEILLGEAAHDGALGRRDLDHRPSLTRLLIASRNGVRDTPRMVPIWPSLMRAPARAGLR